VLTGEVMWGELTFYVKWFCFEVKWRELRWSSWGH